MAILKCNMCGGELDVNADFSVGICRYCDSVITIPKEIDRKGNLYNRAVFLRQNNEFDKALDTYEDILREDNTDAEAHWGLVLSKYGIEYVLDPKTGKRIPTCHRTRSQSILSDPDYLAAIEYSDDESKKAIEDAANQINDIQSKIIEISRKEPPYDIFICYKESDDSGNRTQDSLLAQDLYYELIKRNYRVFFARKTLESKLGAEYEPIIFAALSSAKVMIVLGTTAEHFNSPWVKNEWSRFLDMSRESDKTVIPAYRGMSPYELPAELSALQSQDMSKIGFMQDLTDGIERCLRKNQPVIRQSAANTSGQLERLLQNCNTYLKLENYEAANSVYLTITKEYPEEYKGWWGLIVCKTVNFTNLISDQSELNTWYKYSKQLASEKDFEPLEKQYVEYTRKLVPLSVESDIESVKAMIRKHIENINLLGKRVDDYKKEISSLMNTKAEHTTDFRIYNYNKQIAAYEKQKTLKLFFLSAGIASIVLCFVLSFISSASEDSTASRILFIVLACSGILLTRHSSKKYPSFKKLREYAAQDRGLIEMAQRELAESNAADNRNIERLNLLINDTEAQIAEKSSKIKNCNDYIALGKDKISEYWFFKRCEMFGVKIECDDRIKEKRDAAFGK